MIRVWFICEKCGTASPVLERRIGEIADFAISMLTFMAFSASNWGFGIFSEGLICPECKQEEYDANEPPPEFIPPSEEDEDWLQEYDPNWYYN